MDPNSEPRLAELVAMVGIYSEENVTADNYLAAACLEYLHGGSDDVPLSTDHSDPLLYTIRVRTSSNNQRCGEASMHLRMPYGYPNNSLSFHITSPQLRRQWTDTVSATLADAARIASQEGRECVYDLVELLQRQIDNEVYNQVADVAATSYDGPSSETNEAGTLRQAGASAMADVAADCTLMGVGGPDRHGVEAGGGCGVRAVMLRIDHMHNKRMYTNTIAGWVKDLGLKGCLLFQASLILLLLEGSSEHVKEYLTLHRTNSVDVDSRGRKCRERMMVVVAEDNRLAHSLDAFRIMNVDSMDEVKQILQRAGWAGCWREAVGLT